MAIYPQQTLFGLMRDVRNLLVRVLEIVGSVPRRIRSLAALPDTSAFSADEWEAMTYGETESSDSQTTKVHFLVAPGWTGFFPR